MRVNCSCHFSVDRFTLLSHPFAVLLVFPLHSLTLLLSMFLGSCSQMASRVAGRAERARGERSELGASGASRGRIWVGCVTACAHARELQLSFFTRFPFLSHALPLLPVFPLHSLTLLLFMFLYMLSLACPRFPLLCLASLLCMFSDIFF